MSSTLVYAIISIVILLLKFFLDQKNKDTALPPTQGEILTEIFPTLPDNPDSPITPLPIEDTHKEKTPQSAANTIQALQQRERDPLTCRRQEKGRVATPPQQQTTKEDKYETKRITLTKREEARRAFIYSEIFNRKYE